LNGFGEVRAWEALPPARASGYSQGGAHRP